MFIVHMASGCTHEEASFESWLDNISILLEEDNDLEGELTHLFNEVFFLSLKKQHNQLGSNYTQNMYRNSV